MVSLRRLSILGFVLVALASATSVVTVLAQARDPIVGNWQLNVAKSTFNPGPALKSESRSYVVAGQEIKATSKTVDAEGKAANGTWTITMTAKIAR